MAVSKQPLATPLLPFQKENVSSNTQTAPLPFFGGTRLIASRWISPALNEITTQVTGGGKKGGGSGGKKGGGAQQSKNYYGQIVVAFGRGPLDWVKALVYNGNYVFKTTSLAITADVTDLTGSLVDPAMVGKGGWLKLYRGTETQPADSGTGAADLGTIKIDAYKLFFGQDTGTPGNLQLIGGHQPRVPTSIVAAEDNIVDDEQVNPIAWLAEYFLDEGGGSLPEAAFDTASWLASAHWCAQDQEHRDYTFCSPLLTEQKSNGDVAKSILEPFNGFLRWTKEGKLAFKIYEWGTNPGGLVTLDERYLTKPAKIVKGDWTAVKTEMLVSFVDRDYEFQTNTVLVPNARARSVRQLDDQGKLDRSHVTRIAQAHRQGSEYNRRMGTAPGKGTLSVHQPFVEDVEIGDKVLVNVNPEPGGIASAQLCRVERIEQDRSDAATVTVMTDALLAASPYTPTWTPPTAPEALCTPLPHVLGIPLPLAAYGWPPAVGFLATRPSQDVLGFQVLFGTDSGLPFADLGNQVGFAVRAALAANITSGAVTPHFTELDGVDGPEAELAAATPGGNEAEAEDDTLIAVLATLDGSGRVALDGDGAAIMEIVSILSRSAVSGAEFAYTVLRGRLGTTARAWTTAAAVWILPRINLEPWRHNLFSALQGDLLYFRLMAYNTKAIADASVPEADINLPAVPAPSSLTATAGTGKSISLNWVFTAAKSFSGEYGIYRATGPGYTDWAKIAETRGTRFVDVEVADATTYKYKIVAITPEEESSAYSNEASATTDDIVGDVAAAAADAIAALSELADIASDNLLTPDEKPRVIQDRDVILAEQTGIDAKATTYTITTEKTAYDSAVTALTTYLATLTAPFLWSDLSGNTTIVGTDFRNAFKAVYDARQTLLNLLFTKINPNAPSDPAAPTYSAEGVYNSAGDGTAFAWTTLNIPAMPSGAQIMNVLYRRHGSSGWIVGDQRNAGGGTSRIDDETPGEEYDYALQAFSADGVGSNIVEMAANPRPAPVKTATPGAYSGVAAHSPSGSWPISARYYSSGSPVQMLGCTIEFTPPGDIDYDGGEWGLNTISGGAPSLASGIIPVGAQSFVVYLPPPVSTVLELWLRPKNRTGVFRAWANTGIQVTSYVGVPAGTMSEQNASNVKVSSLAVAAAGAASPTAVAARVDDQFVVTLAGGSRFEEFDVDLTGRGVTGAITGGIAHVIDPARIAMIATYKLGDAGNTPTNAVMTAMTMDGSNIVAGSYRFMFNLKQL